MYGPASFQSHMCANFFILRRRGGAHCRQAGRLAAELAKLAQRRLKKTHLGRGELRTTSQSCL